MKKLLSILGVIAFTVTPAMTVIACGDNQTEVNPRDLSAALAKKDLGAFTEAAGPSAETALFLVKTNNSEIKWSDKITVTKGTDNKITLTAKDAADYDDVTIELPWHLSARSDVATKFTTNELGAFDHVPTNAEILARITSMVPAVTEADVQIDVNGLQKVAPTADKPGVYRADVSVKDLSTNFNRSWLQMEYTLAKEITDEPTIPEGGTDARVELPAAPVTNIELAAEKDKKLFTHHPSAQQIIDAFIKVNTKEGETPLNAEEFMVTVNGANGSATIAVKPGSKVYKPKTINVKYDFIENISNRIWVRDLGNFAKTPTAEEIIAKIVEVNKNQRLIDPKALEVVLPDGGIVNTTKFLTIKAIKYDANEGKDGTQPDMKEPYPIDETVVVYFTITPETPATK